MDTEDPPRLVLRDPLATLPRRDISSRYSKNHFHPQVSELVAVNDNDEPPPRPNWVAARVISRPNGQLATYHEKNPTFTAFSRKTRRLVSEESWWERLYRVWWNLDPDVRDFEMQGLRVHVFTEDDDKESIRTLDAILARGGRCEGQEVKASGSHFMAPKTRQMDVNVHDILERIDIGYNRVTGNALLENARLLKNLSYGTIHKDDAVPPAEREAVVRAMSNGAATFGEIQPLLGSCPLLQKAKAFSLLASGAIWFDLQKELNHHSPVRAPAPSTAPDIRNIDRRLVR